MILVLRTPWRYPDKLVARVLAWLVKICEGQETTKPAMPPEIAEYAAAAAAYDKAWEAYRGLDDKAAEEAHDRAMERLNKAEKVIEKNPPGRSGTPSGNGSSWHGWLRAERRHGMSIGLNGPANGPMPWGPRRQ